MNNRPKNLKTARNKNVLIVGGSGSGKTRLWLKPNLMQLHSSYVVTDPKGSIIVECGKLLQKNGYRFSKLGCKHIEYVACCPRKNRTRVHNIKQYLTITPLIENTGKGGCSNARRHRT